MTTNGRATRRLTMAQAVVSYLQVQHSERDGGQRRLVAGMWGIFGHGNVAGMGQALEEHGGELPFHQARNEQSMVHASTAYAKASRRLSTMACTASIGPGSLNMVTGAALATINRLPVLLFPSDVYATRHQGPVLQQLEHPLAGDVSVNDAFRPVSRFFDRISRPEQLLTALPEAMRVLTSPVEAGAVVLALPQDVQDHAYDYPASFFDVRVWRVARPAPERGAIEEAAEVLRGAARPVIVAGGGVLYAEAEAELAALAEAAGIPVVETFGGKGAMTEEGWRALGGLGLEGNPGANEVVGTADVVLCVGTRLTDFATGSQSAFHPAARFVNVNVSDRDARKEGALPVVADAREALLALRQALVDGGVRGDAPYRDEVEAIRERWRTTRAEAFAQVPGERMSQGQLIGVLNEAARPGDTLIAAAGGPPGDLLKIWDATDERHCHLEFGFSCMGYELPAALGVRLAQPEGEVTALIGDGTFLMSPSELVTALQEGLKITLVIADNQGFQCIRRLQMAKAGVEFGNELRALDPASGRLDGDYLTLDLVKAAEGLGARAVAADTPDDLRRALAETRGAPGPTVIVAQVERHRNLPPSGVWWDVAPSEVSSEDPVRERRAAYEKERAELQHFHY